MIAGEIATALRNAYRSGAWWRCPCPVHDSRGPTLALREGEDEPAADEFLSIRPLQAADSNEAKGPGEAMR